MRKTCKIFHVNLLNQGGQEQLDFKDFFNPNLVAGPNPVFNSDFKVISIVF